MQMPLGDLVAMAANAAMSCRPAGAAATAAPRPQRHRERPPVLRLGDMNPASAAALLSLPGYWQPGGFEAMLEESGACADRHFLCTDLDASGPDPSPFGPPVDPGVEQEGEWFFDSIRIEQNLEWAAEQVHKGVERARQGHLGEAIKHYDYALSIYPNHVDALVGRAAALANARNYIAALNDLEAALARDPQCETARRYYEIVRERMAIERGDVLLDSIDPDPWKDRFLKPSSAASPETQLHGAEHSEEGIAASDSARRDEEDASDAVQKRPAPANPSRSRQPPGAFKGTDRGTARHAPRRTERPAQRHPLVVCSQTASATEEAGGSAKVTGKEEEGNPKPLTTERSGKRTTRKRSKASLVDQGYGSDSSA
eukprot:scaffold7381_cov310-Pinguiococcus_pyrenoidosus.AAC.92